MGGACTHKINKRCPQEGAETHRNDGPRTINTTSLNSHCQSVARTSTFTPVDLEYHTKEFSVNSKRVTVASVISPIDPRNQSHSRGPLATRDRIVNQAHQGGDSAHSDRYDPEYVQGHLSCREQNPQQVGPSSNVVHIRKGGRYFTTTTRGHHKIPGRHTRHHFSTGQGCQTQGALHGIHNTLDTVYGLDLQRMEANGVGPTTFSVENRRDEGDLSPCPQDLRGKVDTQRILAVHGRTGSADPRFDAIQRPLTRKDATTILELGTDLKGQSHDHGGSGKIFESGVTGMLGDKVPSWEALTGRKSRNTSGLPLHVKPEVLGSLKVREVLKLPQSETKQRTLEHALRWIEPSEVYAVLQSGLDTFTSRDPRVSFTDTQLKVLLDVRKLTPTADVAAWCNGFTLAEDRPEGARLRPIFEPLINDILVNHVNPLLHTTTRYTPRNEIRAAVFRSSAAVQFDYAAWFDQIKLHESIQRFFGVGTPGSTYCLPYLPMGYRPSCEVAEALTESISDVPDRGDVFVATCVDNILFTGDNDRLVETAEKFVERCAKVGALLKNAEIEVSTCYDFLGEHYDHTEKTRCLTSKTQQKAAFGARVLAAKTSLTTRQILALYGLLLYAANTLRITVGRYHWAMRFLSSVAATPLTQHHQIPADALEQLSEWADIAAKNVPVPVWTPTVEPDLEIYTDASAHGWGAISLSAHGTLMQESHEWTVADWQNWNLSSSVAAEPLALIKSVACLVPVTAKHVRIHTDHLPLVWAFRKGFGKAFAYSNAIRFLSEFANTTFELCFIEGILNPADVLSRARQHTTCSLSRTPYPPLLPVTSVGGVLRGTGG